MPDRAAVRIPVLRRGARVVVLVDGRPVAAHAGEMLAAALMAAGILRLRQSPADGTPRGAFCFMGACQECLVRVEGKVRQSCMVRVADGLEVELIGAGGEVA